MVNKNPTSDVLREFREYSWKYFHGYADQRLKSFHFYLLLSTLITSGMVRLWLEGRGRIVGTLLGVLQIVFSFLFWRLDSRNKFGVDLGRNALKLIEQKTNLSSKYNSLNLMIFEKQKIDEARLRSFFGRLHHPSYTNCFNFIFWLFGCCAFGFIIGNIWLRFNVGQIVCNFICSAQP